MTEVFRSVCSFPPAGTRLVAAAPLRGTFDIIWSCISIFILCTLSVHHPNVHPTATPGTNRQRWRQDWHLFGRKLAFMVKMLVLPEYVLGSAVAQLEVAMSVRAEINRRGTAKGDEHEMNWTLADTLLANMGGIAVEFPSHSLSHSHSHSHSRCSSQHSACDDVEADVPPIHDARRQQRQQRLAVEKVTKREFEQTCRFLGCEPRSEYRPSRFLARHAKETIRYGDTGWAVKEEHKAIVHSAWKHRDARLRPLRFRAAHDINMMQGRVWVLDTPQLIRCKERGIIAQLPKLPENELSDRNKSDVLIKSLAILQIGWLAVQLSVRAYYGLPSTQIEVLVLAYGVIAVFLYCVYWEKPRDITTVSRFRAARPVDLADMVAVAQVAPARTTSVGMFPRRMAWIPDHHCSLPGPADPHASVHLVKAFLYSGVAGTVFGALHFFAVAQAFPSELERVLWIAAASLTSGIPVVVVAEEALVVIFRVFDQSPALHFFRNTFHALCAVVYTAARLYIVSEALRALFFLPPEAFRTTWTANAPHIS